MSDLRKILLGFLIYGSFLFSCRAQTFSSPHDFSGLKLWFRADSGVVSSFGIVDSLKDLSGLNNHAIQTDSLLRPSLIENIPYLNNLSAIRFDGIYDFLEFSSSLDSIRSIFFVLKEKENSIASYRPLLGHSTIYDFHRGTGRKLWGGNTNSYITQGETKINGNIIDGTSTDVPTKYCILSLLTSGNVNAGNLSKDRGNADRIWDGDFAEIIIYNQPLGSIQRSQVENYLHIKYAPPVNLGSDIIISYGFHDTTIYAGQRFTNFQWLRNGVTLLNDSLENISINLPGVYKILVTDIFNAISADSINVIYPISQLPSSIIICKGDSALLGVSLGNDYSYLWSNGKTTDSIYVTQPQLLYVTITDSTGYFITDSINVILDTFSDSISLGPDRGLCVGDNISLISGNNLVQTYLWSDTSSNANLAIFSPGEYSLNVSNINGCYATDTILISIIGIAPNPGFSFEGHCSGSPVVFIDTSTVPPPFLISNWEWNFGDGNTSDIQNPTHTFSNSGIYNITLTVITDSGCSSTISHIDTIVGNPTADFNITAPVCVDQEYQFFNNTLIATYDSLYSLTWYFGDGNTSYLLNPNHIYSLNGDYTLSLAILSQFGCKDSTTSVISVPNQNTLPSIPLLINPYNLSYPGTNVNFTWNLSSFASYYSLKIASEENFSNILFYEDSTINNTVSVPNLPADSAFFWKVVSYSPCGDSSSSVIFKFMTFNPTSISGIELWLAANMNVPDTNGIVSIWNSASSNILNNAIQFVNANKPILVDSIAELYFLPIIRFDGDDFMSFPEINNIRSAFFVIKHKTGTQEYPPLLGHSLLADWHGGYSTSLMDGHESAYITNGLFFCNGISKPLYAEPKPTKYSILSFITTENTSAERITNDRVYGRCWDGDFAEIIIYNQSLDSNQRKQIEQYLHYKYAPPVNLGPDINIAYGFCDTSIYAGQRFTNFQWTRNGVTNPADTIENITINQSGTYKITVTDIFGFPSSDSIIVTFPAFTQLSDTTICFGDTLHWNLNLNGYYNYLWNDANTSAIRNITLENTYQVTITDTTAQCTLVTQPIFVNVDSFPNFVTLGPDISVCTGNTLYLQNGYNEAVSYLWNNGSTNNNYIVSTLDTIIVTVTDSLGCIGTDSLIITGISGVAPTANFIYQGICFGDTTYFADASNGTGINSWIWNFNNLGTSPDSNTHYIFSNPGTFPVKLIINTMDGCSNSVIKDIQIHHLPEPDFISKNNCSDNYTKFENHSAIQVDSIINYVWSFGDNSSIISENPNHSYTDTGSYIVTLIATSNFGCIDTITKTIKIKKSPLADFLYSPVCKGQLVYFADHTQTSGTNQIIERKWEFGDASYSLANNPSHTYNVIDTFLVKLITKSINGCIDTAYKTLIVTLPPDAKFSDTSACVNTLHQLLDSSISTLPVTQWKWTIDSIGLLTNQNPTVTFTSTGQYSTKLIVLTQAGCSDTISHIINVHNNPTAGFVIIPEVATPLQTVTFNNLTSGANQYFWNFGDGYTSSYFEPVHTFADSGIYIVSLISLNTYGCSDSMLSSIRIIVPQFDIAVLEINSTTTGNFIKVSAKIANFGSLPIDSVYLYLDMGNGVMIKEALNYHLQAGEIINYNFTSQLEITPQNTPAYICVDAMPPLAITDFAPANNHYCKALVDNFEVLPPYPSPVKNYIYIEFIIPAEGNVLISLYNSLGQKMKILFNLHANAGFNRYVYLAGEISNGAYYYQVEYNGKIKTRKFIKY